MNKQNCINFYLRDLPKKYSSHDSVEKRYGVVILITRSSNEFQSENGSSPFEVSPLL